MMWFGNSGKNRKRRDMSLKRLKAFETKLMTAQHRVEDKSGVKKSGVVSWLYRVYMLLALVAVTYFWYAGEIGFIQWLCLVCMSVLAPALLVVVVLCAGVVCLMLFECLLKSIVWLIALARRIFEIAREGRSR